MPHLVLRVASGAHLPLERIGPRLSQKSLFGPGGTNVNLVWRESPAADWQIRTWERGVAGETLACGTGAVAAAIVAHLKGKSTSPTRVIPHSGEVLTIYYEGGENIREVYLEGEVRIVYQGWLCEEGIS